jgi:tetratricopeptide (TPR) repeat protein
MKLVLKLSLFLIILSALKINAQNCEQKPTGDKMIANDYFSYGMYPCALKEYQLIYASKPKNKKTNHRIAQCYLLSPGGNKSKAIKYLTFLIEQESVSKDVYFELGQAYLYAQQFDKAIDFFEKYETIAKPSGDDLKILEKFKDCASFSKELVKHPLNVTFENLGKDVNSEHNDMQPYLTDKEDFIYFTTDRKGTRGGFPFSDGYVKDVFITKNKKGRDAYKSARGVSGTFNTDFSEEMAGGSADGSHLFVASDEQFQTYNLKYSSKPPKKRSYSSLVNLEGINGRNSNELSATITNDGSFIIFSSNRDGGFGGFDLWMSKKLPNNSWGIPINMGPKINTQFDENFPMFKETQDKITFSSNGHRGMGGFDLFETTFSKELKTWTDPKNLGFPINTAYDDNNIIFVKNGRYAYKSDIRKDSRGMRDIYRITFNDVQPTYTVVKSSIFADTLANIPAIAEILEKEIGQQKTLYDSLKTMDTDSSLVDSIKHLYFGYMGRLNALDPLTNNLVEVRNKEGDLYGRYTPNSRNGGFIMILEPGLYEVNILHNGYEAFTKKIRIFDKINYTPQLKRDFYIKPKASL